MSEMLEEIIQYKEDTQYGKYLDLPLGKDELGLEIQYVTEIVGLQKISNIPPSFRTAISVVPAK